MPNARRPDDFLPLKPLAFQILLTLTDGDYHGYAIAQDISQRTSARLQLRPGNLYRELQVQLDEGLIEECPDRRDEGDERRRYYRITRLGHRVARLEAERLRALVADARAARLLKGSGRA